MLHRHPHAAVSLFAIWEPILDDDTAPPNLPALQRLNDPRVRQFWDPGRRMAAILRTVQLPPHCCVYQKTYLWDLIAAWTPGARWQAAPPRPALFDGTMLRTAPQLDALLHP